MTDLEMTKLCAEAMGLHIVKVMPAIVIVSDDKTEIESYGYDPIENDAQAMALVKRFEIAPLWMPKQGAWEAWLPHSKTAWPPTYSLDLNRAIVECVAKMQAAKNAHLD